MVINNVPLYGVITDITVKNGKIAKKEKTDEGGCGTHLIIVDSDFDIINVICGGKA